MEIHNSKEPVAMVMYPSRVVKAYKLRVLSGKYFYVREAKKFEGIFELDPRRAFFMGKTPIYFFDSRNCMPIDPIIVDELAIFAKSNQLTRITTTDKTHSTMLLDIMKTVKNLSDGLTVLIERVTNRNKETNDVLNTFTHSLAQAEGPLPSDEELGSRLTNHLVEKGLLNADEKGMIDAQVARGEMTINMLVAMLRDKEILKITQPMRQENLLILEEFGGYNPEQLAGFVDRLRRTDKGVRTMTSVPIKNWMPASIIMAILIGGSIADMILFQNVGDLGALLPMPPEPVQPVPEITPAPEIPPPDMDKPITEPELVWDPELQQWIEP